MYGHRGDYASFAEALAACGAGADAGAGMAGAVTGRTRTIRADAARGRGAALDGRCLQNLSAILLAHGGGLPENLRILDFGGALGGLYFQLREFLRRRKLSWVVCEQPIMADAGAREFETDELSFVSDLDDLGARRFDVVIASGSLQLVEDPHGTFGRLSRLSRNLLINRIPLFDKPADRLTVHHVDPAIYTATCPSWFFSESLWSAMVDAFGFDVAMRWKVPQDLVTLDDQTLEFSGMLCRQRS